MIDQTKNLMIGLFVIAAIGVIFFILMFLNPSVGDEGLKLHVRFSDIEKVNLGTRVTYGGKAVGEVVDIVELTEASDTRKATHGQIYLYELLLEVDSSVNVYNSDEITMRTAGLLGEKTIAIIPKPPKEGQALELVNEQIIFASDVTSVEETFKEFQEVANKFDRALDAMSVAFESIQEQNVVGKIGDAAGNFASLTGKLDDDFYLRISSVLNKAETTMDDINHYGILFHLDKGWQRLRARRMNLLQKLSTPQEFRNFFNDEIDTITTSLSRVSMVMEETEQQCLFDDGDFKQVFAELLRRVETLEGSVQMYNQQVVDCTRN